MVGVDLAEAVANGQRPADNILRVEPDMRVASAFFVPTMLIDMVIMFVAMVVFMLISMVVFMLVPMVAMVVSRALDVFGAAQEFAMAVKAEGMEFGILRIAAG